MLHFESRSSKTQASTAVHLYTVHNQNLSETYSAKYLGLTITSDLQWNQHINLGLLRFYLGSFMTAGRRWPQWSDQLVQIA